MNSNVRSQLGLSDREFQLISGLVEDKFGIHLETNKKALIISRLNKLILSKNVHSFQEYYEFLKADRTGHELLALIDKISTNHSFFFRETEHFQFLKEIFPILIKAPHVQSERKIKIWSAGCAAGEEPYSLAMILTELLKTLPKGIEVKILATDVSTSVLESAKEGIYTLERLKLVPEPFFKKYFNKMDEDHFAVKKSIKEMVLYKRLNFMRDSFPFKGKFDVVFCRNVMIYFTKETRDTLVDKIASFIYNNGYLFIGHSETLGRDHTNLKYIKPAVYQRD